MDPTRRLAQSFYAREALALAHDLLGRWLRRGPVTLRITEVEAYHQRETACHAYRGQTPRNRPLFGPAGRVYMYLCYGIHQMLNIVAGEEGVAQGVLVRACAPVDGLDLVAERRGGRRGPVALTGPGKIGAALALDLSWTDHPLYEAGGLELLVGEPVAGRLVGPRVGIGYADPEHQALPWRIAEAGTPWVSARKTLRPG